jgi:hypothetical protein
MRRSCSDLLLTASQVDGVIGSDNGGHALVRIFRQSVFGRLAGYEDKRLDKAQLHKLQDEAAKD